MNVMPPRPAQLADREMIAGWIALDPDHAGTDPNFFITPEPHTNCFVWCDQQGPIFAFRLSRLLRVDVQFNPAEKARTREALAAGVAWIRQQGWGSGFRELIFQSVNRLLINFCKRKFHFHEAKDELLCSLGNDGKLAS
jgi:hypothetical protein